MSLLKEAKMPSLKDKIEAQRLEAEALREKEEEKDITRFLTIKKKSKKN